MKEHYSETRRPCPLDSRRLPALDRMKLVALALALSFVACSPTPTDVGPAIVAPTTRPAAPTPVAPARPLSWLKVSLVDVKTDATVRVQEGFRQLNIVLALTNDSSQWNVFVLPGGSSGTSTNVASAKVVDTNGAEHDLSLLGNQLYSSHSTRITLPPMGTMRIAARAQIPQTRDVGEIRIGLQDAQTPTGTPVSPASTIAVSGPGSSGVNLFPSPAASPPTTSQFQLKCPADKVISVTFDSIKEFNGLLIFNSTERGGPGAVFKVQASNRGGATYSLSARSFFGTVYSSDGTWTNWSIGGGFEAGYGMSDGSGIRTLISVPPDQVKEDTVVVPIAVQQQGFSGQRPLLIRMVVNPQDSDKVLCDPGQAALFSIS